MKKLLCSVTLLAALAVHAEVVVYTQSYSISETGAGRTRTTSYTGYLILDTTGRLIQLDARTVSYPYPKKKMRVTEYESYNIDYLDAGTKEVFAITLNFDDVTGAPLMKGTASTVNVGGPDPAPNYFSLPKTMAFSSFVISGTGTNAYMEEFKGTLTMDQKRTQAENKALNGADETLAALKSTLGAKGYTLVNDWYD